jgi:hypothetical protein
MSGAPGTWVRYVPSFDCKNLKVRCSCGGLQYNNVDTKCHNRSADSKVEIEHTITDFIPKKMHTTRFTHSFLRVVFVKMFCCLF